jgi:hypothetical protein
MTIPAPNAEQSRIAQSKYHAMIDDIARQCSFIGRRWRPSSWKRLLCEAFVNVERDDAEARGDPDPFPERTMLLVGLDGGSIVHLGEQTRHFTRAQSNAFVESIYAYGSEQGVTWSEKSKKHIAEVRRSTQGS